MLAIRMLATTSALAAVVALTAGTAPTTAGRSWPQGASRPLALAAAPVPQVKVEGDQGWQKTELALEDGQKYTIAYVSGTWTVDHTNFDKVGPDGYSPDVDEQIYQGCKLDTGLPYARLLGRVGDGPLFSVGEGGDFTAERKGTLSLRIHDSDDCLVDNTGHVEMDLATAADPPPKEPDACDDVFFLGARGSDEKAENQDEFGGMGKPVHHTYIAFQKAADLHGVTVKAKPLTYPASAVWWLIAERIHKLTSSVREGVRATKAVLTEQRQACKDQQFVLVGYSQGAWVLSASLFETGMPDIAAIVLLGDPRFDGDAPGAVVWPRHNRDRDGVVATDRKREDETWRYLPESVTEQGKAWSYCNSQQLPVGEFHDVVCNWPPSRDKGDVLALVALKGPHFKYHDDAIVKAAVRFLTKRVLQ